MHRVIQQYSALVHFFGVAGDQIPDAAAQACGIQHKLLDVDTLFGLVLLQPLMDAFKSAVTRFQSQVCHSHSLCESAILFFSFLYSISCCVSVN